jgi:uncharacterized protein
MSELEDILKYCSGFEWDEGNGTKNGQKHQVSKGEAEQVFFNEPLLIFDSTGLQEKRYLALGTTNKERLLAIIFTVRKRKLVRVISARNMSRKERNAYGKEK